MEPDALLHLLRRFQIEGVQYILVGGQAVRLNGFVWATEYIDILLPSSIDNGRRVIRALSFLSSSQELEPEWFAVTAEEPENIRVADELLIDLLFAANGQTHESLLAHMRLVMVEDVEIRTLDIEGLLKTKTDYRDKDRLDREVLQRLQAQLQRSAGQDLARDHPSTLRPFDRLRTGQARDRLRQTQPERSFVERTR